MGDLEGVRRRELLRRHPRVARLKEPQRRSITVDGVQTQVVKPHAGRQSIPNQDGGLLGQQDLPAVSGNNQALCPQEDRRAGRKGWPPRVTRPSALHPQLLILARPDFYACWLTSAQDAR